VAETCRGLLHPFAPVWNADSLALVLGTFPSVQSRENAFYYGHPQNRFWRVLAALFGGCVPCGVNEKKELLLKSHIALWDVLAACDITGSADGSIRNALPNDIGLLLRGAPIRCVFANGGRAAAFYRRFCEQAVGVPILALPSTSPANARWSAEALATAWQPLKDCVSPPQAEQAGRS
jgi:double-stranded uracil-DNA glycosylase